MKFLILLEVFILFNVYYFKTKKYLLYKLYLLQNNEIVLKYATFITKINAVKQVINIIHITQEFQSTKSFGWVYLNLF